MGETVYKLDGDTEELERSLAAVVRGLVAVEQEGAKAEAELKKLRKVGTDSAKGLETSLASLAKVGFGAVAAGAGAAAVALGALAKDTIAYRQEVVRLHDATGVGTDTIGGMGVALERVGLGSEKVAAQVAGFSKRLSDFGRGGGEAAATFEALGISAEEVRAGTLGTDEALRRVLATLPRMGDETEAAAGAQRLFGESGVELLGALRALPLEQATELARAYGRVVDEEAAESTRQWARGMADLRGAVSGVTADILDWIDVGLRMEQGLTAIVMAAAVVNATLAELAQRVRETGDPMEAFFAANWVQGLREGAAAAQDAAAGFQSARAEVDAAAESGAVFVDEFVGPTITDIELLNRKFKEQAEAAREAAQAQREGAAALEELRRIGLNAGLDLVSAEERVTLAAEEQIRELEELGRTAAKVGADRAEVEVAIQEVQERAMRDIAAIREETHREETERLEELARANREAAEESADAWEAGIADLAAAFNAIGDGIKGVIGDIAASWAAAARAVAQAWEDVAGALLAAEQRQLEAVLDRIDQTTSAEEDRTDARRESLEQETADIQASIDRQRELEGRAHRERLQDLRERRRELRDTTQAEIQLDRDATAARLEDLARQRRVLREHVIEAFRAQKAASIVSIEMDAAAAVIRALAELGPIAGAVAATAIGISAAAQTAIVAAAEPPLHLGTDEVRATLRAGEAVLTPRAADAVGRERISALNRGDEAPSSQAATARGGGALQLVVRDRVMDRIVSGALQTGGRLAAALGAAAGPMGQRDPFGAGAR